MFNQIADAASSLFQSPDTQQLTTGTSGSPEAQNIAQNISQQYQAQIDQGAPVYSGPVPGAQGDNMAQQRQYQLLGGLQPGNFQNARNIAGNIASWTPDQIASANRSGGPGGGYMDPFEAQVIGGLKGDYKDMMDYMGHTVGAGARGSNAFDSDRHGVATGEGGRGITKDFMNKLAGVRSGGYSNAMNWLGQDQGRALEAQIASGNQAARGKGINLQAANQSTNINPDLALAGAFGNYGLNQQNQQNMADQFGYSQFMNQQNYVPNLLNQYSTAMSGMNPMFQQNTSQTQHGQGTSPFMTAAGLGMMGLGAYGSGVTGGLWG